MTQVSISNVTIANHDVNDKVRIKTMNLFI